VDGIEHYVDRRVAHYDQRELTKPVPTFKDLEVALKTLEELVLFYWPLLKGFDIMGLLPAILDDWKEVFRFPWVDEESNSE
jgi:hypothetical protein